MSLHDQLLVTLTNFDKNYFWRQNHLAAVLDSLSCIVQNDLVKNGVSERMTILYFQAEEIFEILFDS